MDENMIDYILSALQIDKKMIQELITYQYPTPSRFKSKKERLCNGSSHLNISRNNTQQTQFGSDAFPWHMWTLLGYIAYQRTLESVKKMMSIVGEKSFCDAVFLKTAWGNALQMAMMKKNWNVVKYMLNVPSIRTRYTEEELKELYSQMPQGLN
eukprot:220196_1